MVEKGRIEGEREEAEGIEKRWRRRIAYGHLVVLECGKMGVR